MPAPEADARGRILEAIAAMPGIHLRELERHVGISFSGVSHHVRALEKEGAIIGVSDPHYRRYFLSGLILPNEARELNEVDRRLLAECQRPASLAIVLNLAADGPMTHAEIGTRLKKSKGTVSYHLSRLMDARVVRIVPGPRGETCELVDANRVTSVLVTFSASLRDHVDGFARLWLSLRE